MTQIHIFKNSKKKFLIWQYKFSSFQSRPSYRLKTNMMMVLIHLKAICQLTITNQTLLNLWRQSATLRSIATNSYILSKPDLAGAATSNESPASHLLRIRWRRRLPSRTSRTSRWSSRSSSFSPQQTSVARHQSTGPGGRRRRRRIPWRRGGDRSVVTVSTPSDPGTLIAQCQSDISSSSS